ncbi:MAG: hypothetical protein ACR2IJ_02365 [Fluviibacter sp.]
MANNNIEPGKAVSNSATPKQLTYIYNAYLKAGLTDTTRLTEIANSFMHPEMAVKHWMDIDQVIASHWIDAIKRTETIRERKRQAREYDPDRYE